MNGNENDTLFSNEIIGVVYIVAVVQHKFITKDMQNTISVKNRLIGLFQSVNLATTNNITDRTNAEHIISGWRYGG